MNDIAAEESDLWRGKKGKEPPQEGRKNAINDMKQHHLLISRIQDQNRFWECMNYDSSETQT